MTWLPRRNVDRMMKEYEARVAAADAELAPCYRHVQELMLEAILRRVIPDAD